MLSQCRSKNTNTEIPCIRTSGVMMIAMARPNRVLGMYRLSASIPDAG